MENECVLIRVDEPRQIFDSNLGREINKINRVEALIDGI